MARTIPEIKYIITGAKDASENLSKLTSTSKTAQWNLWADNIAYAHLVLEQQFDQHKIEVDARIKNLKPHSPTWYRNKALAFQYGFDLIKPNKFDLITDTDNFNNEGYSDEDIEASKVIKYAAVAESEIESRLIIKIATEDGAGNLSPVEPKVLAAFVEYMKEIRDAGVQITIVNYLPDILKLQMKIYYNPLVIDANGNYIQSGQEKPVEKAIAAYMKTLPFNGELVLAHFIDALQQVPGVEIPHLMLAESKWIDPKTSGYGDFQTVDVRIIPESGYFKVEDYTGIEYVV